MTKSDPGGLAGHDGKPAEPTISAYSTDCGQAVASAQAWQVHERSLARSLAAAGDFVDGLATDALPALVGASAAAVIVEQGVRQVGPALGEDDVRSLAQWLHHSDHDVYVTDCLSRDIPQVGAGYPVAGLMSLSIAPELGEYVLWFRFGEADGEPVPWSPAEVEAARALRRLLLSDGRRRASKFAADNRKLLDEHRAKDDFIAAVSHELRNPLNVVSGWITLIRSGTLELQQRERALTVVDKNVRIQRKIVEDLLDVSKATRGQLVLEWEQVDLSSVIEECLHACMPDVQAKSLDLTVDVPPGLGPIRGDADRLRQVLSNLVTNAIKFTPNGGTLRVEAKSLGREVELSVSDTGTGISEEFLPHVFEAFRQAGSARKRSGGLGLGLTIAKHLVELHAGRISAESNGAGKGATFRVFLPIAARP